MSVFPDQGGLPNPVETLEHIVDQRQKVLGFLVSSFRHAAGVVQDTDRINEGLAVSSRPDLVIADHVDFEVMEQINTPSDIRKPSNFTSGMSQIGITIYGASEKLASGKLITPQIGKRQLTTSESLLYYTLGGRTDIDYAQTGVPDEDVDYDFKRIFAHTPLRTPSFMRMWTLFPRLTRHLMTQCLDEGKRGPQKEKAEELFVAYNLMARLIDRNDPHVLSDGEIDRQYLMR